MADKKYLKGIIIDVDTYRNEMPDYGEDMLMDIVEKQTKFAKRFHSMFIKRGQKEIIDEGAATVRACSMMVQDNLACITNEVEEIREWLPWKHWKNYTGFDIDLEEIRLEYIDLLHLVVEGMILLGMNAEDIHRYYQSKMIENVRRQTEGYK